MLQRAGVLLLLVILTAQYKVVVSSRHVYNLKSVSVGTAGVWVTDADEQIYHRLGTYNKPADEGCAWSQIKGSYKQVDVGYNIVWAVNSKRRVFYRTGINASNPEGTEWVKVKGALNHVSVSDQGHVWGIDKKNKVVILQGASNCNPAGNKWKRLDGNNMKQVSVGDTGVWAVNNNDEVFYRTGTYGDSGFEGTGWEKVDGTLKSITSGIDIVIGVNASNYVHIRQDVSAANPTGSQWNIVTGLLNVVDGYDNALRWGADTDNKIYRS